MYSSSGERSSRKRRASGSRFALPRWARYAYIRLVRINDSPQKVAAGLAVGVFLGILPTFGLGILIALALAIRFKFNKAASILGSLIMNPLTTPLFWTASSVLGAFLANRDWHRTLEIVQAFSSHLSVTHLSTREGWAWILKGVRAGVYVYLLGNILIALFLSVLFYLVGLHFVQAYRQKKRQRIRGYLPARGQR